MVGQHHLLDGHEFEQAQGVGEGQGSLVYCSPWGGKEADMTKRLNNSYLSIYLSVREREVFLRIGSHNYEDWQVQNLQGGSVGWRSTEELYFKSKGSVLAEFPLPPRMSVFFYELTG